MPLDMRETRLADIASWHGVKPVPSDTLRAHIQTEFNKHRGSWWFRHPDLGTSLAIGSFLFSGMAGIVCVAGTIIAAHNYNGDAAGIWGSGFLVFWGICTWITTKGFFSVRGVKVYGPALWREFEVYHLRTTTNIPESIRDKAAILLREVPDAQIILGKLIRDSVVIDPYLVLRRGQDEICLGIWDDTGILHEATYE